MFLIPYSFWHHDVFAFFSIHIQNQREIRFKTTDCEQAIDEGRHQALEDNKRAWILCITTNNVRALQYYFKMTVEQKEMVNKCDQNTTETNLVKVVVDTSAINGLRQQSLEGVPWNFVGRKISTTL